MLKKQTNKKNVTHHKTLRCNVNIKETFLSDEQKKNKKQCSCLKIPDEEEDFNVFCILYLCFSFLQKYCVHNSYFLLLRATTARKCLNIFFRFRCPFFFFFFFLVKTATF